MPASDSSGSSGGSDAPSAQTHTETPPHNETEQKRYERLLLAQTVRGVKADACFCCSEEISVSLEKLSLSEAMPVKSTEQPPQTDRKYVSDQILPKGITLAPKQLKHDKKKIFF